MKWGKKESLFPKMSVKFITFWLITIALYFCLKNHISQFQVQALAIKYTCDRPPALCATALEEDTLKP